MWKYKCRSQFFILLISFAAGFLMAMMAGQNDVFQSLMSETLPAQTAAQLSANPLLLGLSGGLGFAGLCNVFIIGNMLTSYYSGSVFLFMVVLMMFPDFAIMVGVFTMPVMLIVSLYGWISLNSGVRRNLKRANVSGDDEIIREYLLRHKLDPQYEALAAETKKTLFKVNLAYSLGLVAIFSVLFFMNSLLLDMILIMVCLFAFQYLNRLRASAFQSVANLLLTNCDPEACLSALIYMSKGRRHYKIAKRGLFAQCLIYLNEPGLAQDTLIAFPRSNFNNCLTYWSLMGYIYYLLKDENGLVRCRDELQKLRPAMGTVGMMMRSEELASLENKINLMRGDFNTCKKYYLNLLQRSVMPLQKADCDYYIALISFVQEDYVLAKMYFEKTISVGNKLYFVWNAKNYLRKIEETEDPSQTTYALSIDADSTQAPLEDDSQEQ